MKYDDASWHYGGDFPSDLPIEAGGTHRGMFVAWALLTGLAGEIHLEDLPEGLAALKEKSITPGPFFLRYCDGKFTDEDLDDEGNAFASKYYGENGQYISDYSSVFDDDSPSLYHVQDTWENFDALKPVLDARFAAWRGKG